MRLVSMSSAVQTATEEELILRIRDGDRAAFEKLFRTFQRDLFRFALYYVKKSVVAEDIVQDIFFNIWKNKKEWRPRESLRTYLLGAVRNHVQKQDRHQRVRSDHEGRGEFQDHPKAAVASEGTDFLLRHNEFILALEEAIEDMPERRRVVFLLSRNQDLTYAEIAAVLNISVKTVEAHMTQAMKHLRSRLAPFWE